MSLLTAMRTLQCLAQPITDIRRLRSTDQRLYIYVRQRPGSMVLLGGLKVGRKHLFIRKVRPTHASTLLI